MVAGIQIVLRAPRCSSKIGYLSKFLSNNGRNSNIIAPQRRLISTSRVCFNAPTRKYTDKHEWITVKDNIGTVGITHYAQEALGDVVYAQLPDVEQEVTKDGECGALESVKAASDIYSPVSGKVLEKNEEVENKPGLVNLSCYDKGWLFRVELSKPEEFDQLLTEVEYQKFLKTTES